MMSSCATSPGGAGLPARWRSHALDRRRDLLSESLYWCIIRLEGGREGEKSCNGGNGGCLYKPSTYPTCATLYHRL